MEKPLENAHTLAPSEANQPKVHAAHFVYDTKLAASDANFAPGLLLTLDVPKDLPTRRIYAGLVLDLGATYPNYAAEIRCLLNGSTVLSLPFNRSVSQQGTTAPSVRIVGTEALTGNSGGTKIYNNPPVPDALALTYLADTYEWYISPWRTNVTCNQVQLWISRFVRGAAVQSLALLGCHSEGCQ